MTNVCSCQSWIDTDLEMTKEDCMHETVVYVKTCNISDELQVSVLGNKMVLHHIEIFFLRDCFGNHSQQKLSIKG